MSRDQSTFYYQGFANPNGTFVPDDVFDLLMPHVTDAELRVLLYIIRRTFGFKKHSDDISLGQMVHGIQTRDGKVLDLGAGLSKAAAARAVKGLAEKGIITTTRNSSPERGNEPTTYSLRFRADTYPLSTKETRGSLSKRQALVYQRDTQQTVIQDTVKQQQSVAPPSDPVVVEVLKERGVHQKTAGHLAANYPVEHIYAKVELLDWLVTNKSALVRKNPAGWLRKAIEEDYQAPDLFTRTKAAEERRAEVEQERTQEQHARLQEQAQQYLNVSPEEHAEKFVEMTERVNVQTLGKEPLTAQERREKLKRIAKKYEEDRAEFFRRYPKLAPRDVSGNAGTQENVLPAG